MTVNGRNGNGVSETQIIKFVKFRGNLAHSVALVDAKHNGLSAFVEHGGNLAVGGGDAVGHGCDKADDVAKLNGKLGLRSYLGRNDFL